MSDAGARPCAPGGRLVAPPVRRRLLRRTGVGHACYDGPHHILNGPGTFSIYTFSIYVEYAVLTTAGWATYGEFAGHRISAGGFTDSGGATSCTI